MTKAQRAEDLSFLRTVIAQGDAEHARLQHVDMGYDDCPVCLAAREPDTLDEMIAKVRASLVPESWTDAAYRQDESVFVPDGDAWTDTGRGDV
jgi:hypothetical protein